MKRPSLPRLKSAALLSGLARQGLGVVIVTHDPAVSRVADRVLRIADGRMVENGGGG